MNEIEENVARGIVWMNENLGDDWPDSIDRDTLNLSNGERCILGQAFGVCFGDVEDVMRDGQRWAVNHGFTIKWTESDTGAAFEAIQAEWEKYLDAYEDGLFERSGA